MKILQSGFHGGALSALSSQVGAGASEPIAIPRGVGTVSLGLSLSGASPSARVEYSLSPASMVDNGTARWRTWPAGDVTVDTEDALVAPVTAVRVVSLAGDAILEVVGA